MSSSAAATGTADDDIQNKVQAAAALFQQRFGRPAEFVAVAPGRVNLIGEHTDYNDGFVFPMAINRHTLIAGTRAGKRDAGRIRVHSQAMQADVDIPLGVAPVAGEPAWANYIRGVVVGFLRLEQALPALDLSITSDVPLGAGLSSSAALEVATATAFEAALGTALPPMTKARLCQQAEQDLAGVPCGIMDQATSALAIAGTALLIDCGDETVRAVRLPDEVAVLVTNTGVKHNLADGAYAKRRAECAAAATALGISSLRSTSPAAVEAAKGRMDPVIYRRALHVVNENVRTLAAAGAFLRGDLDAVGGFMFESHRSLRDNYEVSCAELDGLVEIARTIGPGNGVIGARMTGGGFGGSTVTLVRAADAAAVGERLARDYQQKFGRPVAPFVARASQGAHVVLPGAPASRR
jgi:galactokinase